MPDRPASSCNRNLCTLPVGVTGSSSTAYQCAGTLCGARCVGQ